MIDLMLKMPVLCVDNWDISQKVYKIIYACSLSQLFIILLLLGLVCHSSSFLSFILISVNQYIIILFTRVTVIPCLNEENLLIILSIDCFQDSL